MSVVMVFPIPSTVPGWSQPPRRRAPGVHDEPDVELYALSKGPDRLVMIEKYEPEQARSEHAKGAALAGLRPTLAGQAQ
jgi:hypothetical protein